MNLKLFFIENGGDCKKCKLNKVCIKEGSSCYCLYKKIKNPKKIDYFFSLGLYISYSPLIKNQKRRF